MLSSAQRAPRDLLPSPLPGSCKGAAAWLTAAGSIGPSPQCSSQGRAAGSGTQPASAPAGQQTRAVVGKGYWGLQGCQGCYQIRLLFSKILPWFVSQKKLSSARNEFQYLFTFYSLLLVSLKATQDASHSYTHHQIMTAETIEMEVHPTFMNQALNPSV